jgi:cob(I)alamin adenosyltransferase
LSFIFISRQAQCRESNRGGCAPPMSYPTMHAGCRPVNHGVPKITGFIIDATACFRLTFVVVAAFARRDGRRVVHAEARRREDVSLAAAVRLSNILWITAARAFDPRHRTFAPSREQCLSFVT